MKNEFYYRAVAMKLTELSCACVCVLLCLLVLASDDADVRSALLVAPNDEGFLQLANNKK